MARLTEYLAFETENESLWVSGKATSLYFGNGDLLIYDAPRVSLPFNADIGVAGFNASIYADLAFGLEAYAIIGTNSGVDARLRYLS